MFYTFLYGAGIIMCHSLLHSTDFFGFFAGVRGIEKAVQEVCRCRLWLNANKKIGKK